jgi:hypothetical protein
MATGHGVWSEGALSMGCMYGGWTDACTWSVIPMQYRPLYILNPP